MCLHTKKSSVSIIETLFENNRKRATTLFI